MIQIWISISILHHICDGLMFNIQCWIFKMLFSCRFELLNLTHYSLWISNDFFSGAIVRQNSRNDDWQLTSKYAYYVCQISDWRTQPITRNQCLKQPTFDKKNTNKFSMVMRCIMIPSWHALKSIYNLHVNEKKSSRRWQFSNSISAEIEIVNHIVIWIIWA